jgi:two-component system, cell cycle response regulator
MDIIQHKILVMVQAQSKIIIEKACKDIAGIAIFEAGSPNRAFELIYKHIFMLVIIDQTIPGMDIYKIGSMLLSHRKINNTPLLIITDTIKPNQFLNDFQSLSIDYIQKPFNEQLFLAKIKIFLKLFEQKKAVDQSIYELDTLYENIISQHELEKKEAESRKEITNIASTAANQIQQPLQNLQGNIYQLLHTKGLSHKVKSSIASLKTSGEHILQISKKLGTISLKSAQTMTGSDSYHNSDKTYQILYVENLDEDFNIFKHLIINTIKCELIQAKNIELGMELISRSKFDLIFITHRLPEGTGIELISRLRQLRMDIPIIFTLKKTDTHYGPQSIAKGASDFLIKEDISKKNIFSAINYTLRKAKLTTDIEDARDRIVLISKKDYLTKLYNRKYFELEVKSEFFRAKRYKSGLTILMVDFDKFKIINQNHGYDTGDIILTTSASLIQSMVRDSDMVCRYGGEEFGIILPDTGVNGARILAQRMRKKIANHEFKKKSNIFKLTVSIGITSYNPNRDTIVAPMIKRAFAAMTSASKNGGDQIKTA